MSDLPVGWVRAKVGDIADSIQSGFASGDHNREGVGVPHLRPMNIGRDGRLILEDLRFVKTPDGRRLRRGDVLFNNTNSAELVGKTTWIDIDRDLAYSNHMTRVRLPADVSPVFVARQLHHLWSRGVFGLLCNNHVSQASVSAGTLSEEVEINLPPLAEQKRIVAKIEELTARSRRAKEALDAVPPLLDQLRQSIFAAAFRGDLTAAWRAKNPNVEPADKLITRIRAERRARREGALRAQGRDPSRAAYDDVTAVDAPKVRLPNGWEWSTVGQLCEVGTGATPKRGEDKFWEAGNIPWITSGVVNNEFVDQASELVTKRALDETNLTLFPPGTLLVAMYGEGQTRGRCAELRIAATTNQALAGLVTTGLPNVLKEVIKFFLWDRYEFIRKEAAGGVQPNLNLSIIRGLAVPVPPLTEQDALVLRIRQALNAVERLSAQANDATLMLEQFNTAALAKAFRGELVPQDPHDEPASVLLERIRAARASAHSAALGSRQRSRKGEAVADEPDSDETDDDDGAQPEVRPAPNGVAAKDLRELDQNALHDEVFAALWMHGPTEKDEAVRRVAEHLRKAGYVNFQRLRGHGPLYAQVLDAIEVAVRVGLLDRPRRGYVRACKADATAYTADDWRHAVVASLGSGAVDRDDAIRLAAEWARDNLGVEFTRLRTDGHIVEGLRSAINSAIRRGEVTRHGATQISRNPSSSQHMTDWPA